MNRLIILGNGFDLAHGLKTKYSDYINNYWKRVVNSKHSDDFYCFESNPFIIFRGCESLSDILEKYRTKNEHNWQVRGGDRSYHYDLPYGGTANTNIVQIKNNLFHELNGQLHEANWVDIEMYYYKKLKQILSSSSNQSDRYFNHVVDLNSMFKAIANDFDRYLCREVSPEIINRKNSDLHGTFTNNFPKEKEMFFREFPEVYRESLEKRYFDYTVPEYVPFTQKFKKTIVLNFNYTNSINNYFKPHEMKLINIHGQVNTPLNPINLGFGDEKDKFYGEIEDLNENEYLRFMKSFYYTNNENYKTLFDEIEYDHFQVQVMGHSCGLSDRTLLNAIFEHSNCKSIKVYYHKYNSVNEHGEQDNYSEIVKNISRHFQHKAAMRSKIVNRNYCEPLPQLAE